MKQPRKWMTLKWCVYDILSGLDTWGYVGGCRDSIEGKEWSLLELSRVQILVVVANIQLWALKTEVGKGSMRTAIDHGLAGPKRDGNFLVIARDFGSMLFLRKGSESKFLRYIGSWWQHYCVSMKPCNPPERVFSSCLQATDHEM